MPKIGAEGEHKRDLRATTRASRVRKLIPTTCTDPKEPDVTHVKKLPVLRTLSALLAVTALVALWGVVAPATAAAPSANRPTDERFVATELPNSPAGRQLRWLIDASARLPLSEAELRAHFAKEVLAGRAHGDYVTHT